MEEWESETLGIVGLAPFPWASDSALFASNFSFRIQILIKNFPKYSLNRAVSSVTKIHDYHLSCFVFVTCDSTLLTGFDLLFFHSTFDAFRSFAYLLQFSGSKQWCGHGQKSGPGQFRTRMNIPWIIVNLWIDAVIRGEVMFTETAMTLIRSKRNPCHHVSSMLHAYFFQISSNFKHLFVLSVFNLHRDVALAQQEFGSLLRAEIFPKRSST